MNNLKMKLNNLCNAVSWNHVANRLWRRKHVVLVAIILVSLIITVSYTGSNLSSLSLFTSNQPANNLETNILIFGNKWRKFNIPEPNEEKRDLDDLHRINVPVVNDKELPRENGNDRYRNVKRYVPELRLVHIDLKGAPPKVDYFKQIFPLLNKAGANGILLEFEDVFPFEGDLIDAVTENAYSKNDIKQINNLAKENNLQVIPLIQTFGHLEYFLKLQKYRHLREIDEFPQAICPSRNETFKFVTQIIDQVMALYPESRWLHIGCDEVFHIGLCDLCKQHDVDELFLNHVQRVAKYVKDKYNVIPIIWDDMLRQFSLETIKRFQLHQLGIEVMVWTYIDDIYRFVPYTQWSVYAELFPNIWGASAFKGAFGETLTVPNIKMHLDNNVAWLETMKDQVQNFKKIRGLVITGWQRYDHLANLCELLPSAMPSLIIDLLVVNNGRYEDGLLDKFDNLMQCEKNFYYTKENIFTRDPNFFSKSNCKFPGSNVFRVMQEFDIVNKKVDDYLYDVTIHKAWLTDYNVRHNITSPHRINEGLQEYNNVMYSVKALLKMAISALSEVYDSFTVYEWIEQKIYPQLIRLEKFYNNTMQLQKARVWPKRPLKPLDFKRFIENSNNDNNNNNNNNIN